MSVSTTVDDALLLENIYSRINPDVRPVKKHTDTHVVDFSPIIKDVEDFVST